MQAGRAAALRGQKPPVRAHLLPFCYRIEVAAGFLNLID